MYELLLALHLLAAVTWVGGSIALAVLGERFHGEQRLMVTPHFSWYGSRVITGAAVVLLVAGVGLVLELDHVGFGDPWVVVGLAGYLASGIIGGALLGPLGEKAVAAPTLEERERLLTKLMRVARADALIVALVVVDMAVKPGG